MKSIRFGLCCCTAVRPGRLAGIVLLVLGSAACSNIYDVPRSAGRDEISLRIDADSTAVWKRRVTYSVRVYRYECGPQVLDELPPDKRDGYGPVPDGGRSASPPGATDGGAETWRPDRKPPIVHATWPCSGSLFTEAHVRIAFGSKRLAPRRPLDPLEVVSVSVPRPSRCDFSGPRLVREGDVIQCDIRADPDRQRQGPQTVTLVMGRLQDADLGLSIIATPDATSWIGGR